MHPRKVIIEATPGPEPRPAWPHWPGLAACHHAVSCRPIPHTHPRLAATGAKSNRPPEPKERRDKDWQRKQKREWEVVVWWVEERGEKLKR
jgi:hypothetical protein